MVGRVDTDHTGSGRHDAPDSPLRRHLERYAGDLGQVAGIRRATLRGGMQQGLAIAEIDNGGGLSLTVLENACLDILSMRWKGLNLGFLGPAGPVHPALIHPENGAFGEGFRGGMLYTCGLANIGPAGVIEGVTHPTHGRVARLAAEDVWTDRRWHASGCTLVVGGTMREAALFGNTLTLERRVETECFSNRITVTDVVRNAGFAPVPLFLLHHVNFGYPFLEEGVRILIPTERTEPRDAAAETGVARCGVMDPPMDGAQEQVFYHHVRPDAEGMARVGIVNDARALAVIVRYDAAVQPVLVQWKSACSGSYVLGIEPSTCTVAGRASLAKTGTLPPMLEPGESRRFVLQMEVVEGHEAIGSIGTIGESEAGT